MTEQIDIRDLNNAQIKTWEVSDGGLFTRTVYARTASGAVEAAAAIAARAGIETGPGELIPSLVYNYRAYLG